jgi:hypothetical protein
VVSLDQAEICVNFGQIQQTLTCSHKKLNFDKTLANSIKQSKHPAKAERKNKERGPVSKPQEQNPNRVPRGAKDQIMFLNYDPKLNLNYFPKI